MKNTKMRKKLLLSSLAMLMVATVSLGSATYAWFTANPKADASGLSLKTTASAGLVVRTDSDTNWSHTATLYKGQAAAFNLTPVSQEQAETKAANFWQIDASASNNFAHKTDAAMTPASIGGYNGTEAYSDGAVYAEKVYFRLSDGSNPADAASKKVKLTGVTITKNADATMQNAIRVAVANKSGTLIGTYALSDAGANGTLTTAAKTAGEFNPALVTTAAFAEVECPTTSISADGADLTNFVMVYIYLDGQDSDCFSDKVGTVNAAEIISSIKLSFELK